MMTSKPLALAAAAIVAAIPLTASAYVIEKTGRLGQWVTLAPGVGVEPLRVVEDSRCPRNVNCVWAGRVVVSARVRDHGRVSTVRLTLGQPRAIASGRITLDTVAPERTKRSTAPRGYRFGLSYAPAPRRGEMQPMLEAQ